MINFIISAFDWWLRSPPAICFAFIYVMVRFLFSLFYATKWLLFIFCPWIAWYPSVCQLTGILLKIFHGTLTLSCVGQVTELPWSLSNSTSLSELFTSRSACRRVVLLLYYYYYYQFVCRDRKRICWQPLLLSILYVVTITITIIIKF